MNSYLACLFFFKAGIGALLLVGAWNGLEVSASPLVTLALLIFLTFSPAIFAKPLTNYLLAKNFKYLFPILVTSIVTSIFALANLELNFDSWFLTCYFLIWAMIFVGENFLEFWLYTIIQKDSSINSLTAHSRSMLFLQLGTLFGPGVILGIKALVAGTDASDIFAYAATIFIPMLFFFPKESMKGEAQVDDSIAGREIPDNKQMLLIFAFSVSLIWMVIGLFNYAIPVVVKEILGLNMVHIAMAEVAFAASMGFSGLTRLANFESRIDHKKIFLLVSGVFLAVLFFNWGNLYFLFFGVVYLGFAFGKSPIYLKEIIGETLLPQESAKVIALGNAFSAVIVMIAIIFSYLEYSIIKMTEYHFSIVLIVGINLHFLVVSRILGLGKTGYESN